MKGKRSAFHIAAAAATAWLISSAALAQAPASALVGKITSEREGAMEGVLVSAKMVRSTITVTVVSNAQGEYAFPADRLAPGRYQLAIRASGYALDGGGTLDLPAGRPTRADLKLAPAPVTSEQLTNAEWMASAPGTDELKLSLIHI